MISDNYGKYSFTFHCVTNTLLSSIWWNGVSMVFCISWHAQRKKIITDVKRFNGLRKQDVVDQSFGNQTISISPLCFFFSFFLPTFSVFSPSFLSTRLLMYYWNLDTHFVGFMNMFILLTRKDKKLSWIKK